MTFDEPATPSRPVSAASGAPSMVLLDPTATAPLIMPEIRTTRGVGPATAAVSSARVVATVAGARPPPVSGPSTVANPTAMSFGGTT